MHIRVTLGLLARTERYLTFESADIIQTIYDDKSVVLALKI